MPAHKTPDGVLLDWLRALPAQTSSDGATAGQVLVLSQAQRDAIVAVLTAHDADARAWAARCARVDLRPAADRALLQRAHRLLVDIEWGATMTTGNPSCPFCGGLDVSGHADVLRANEVRLQLSVLAYNLGNLWRRLVLPPRIKRWSLTSLQQRLVKTGGRLVKHARNYWLLLAEGHLTRRLFGDMLRRIWALPVPAG